MLCDVEMVMSPTRRRSSIGSAFGSPGRRESFISETTFGYDEGDSITEPETEEEEDDEDESMDLDSSVASSRKSGGSPNKSRSSKASPASARSTPANVGGRGRREVDAELSFGEAEMDVSVDSSRKSKRSSLGGASPFDAGASPVDANTSMLSSGRKSSPKSSKGRQNASFSDDDVEDYGGYGDYDMGGEEDISALSSRSGGSRRVSFGKDTKEVSRGSASKVSSRRSSRSSVGDSPERGSRVSTPSSARSDRTTISTPGSNEFARGAKSKDDTYMESDDDEAEEDRGRSSKGKGKGKGKGKKSKVDDSAMVDTDEEDIDTSGYADDSFASKIGKRGKGRKGKGFVDDAYGGYDQEEDEGLEDSDEDDDGGMRRSRRATKGKKMAWWKGERAIYNKGTMVGLLTAVPTPVNQKKRTLKKVSKADKKSVKKALDESSDEEEADFTSRSRKRIKSEAPIMLPDDIEYMKRGEADEISIWDDPTDTSKTQKVVCYEESLQPPSALPVTANRPPGKDKVGSAAQSFNVPEVAKHMSGWISGFVTLPAQAIKDAEGVGECAQVFFVSECQDGALELGIADPAEPEWHDETAQRQLLKKGDSFYVPPGNIYRLENHSADTESTIFWTIIKPIEGSE